MTCYIILIFWYMHRPPNHGNNLLHLSFIDYYKWDKVFKNGPSKISGRQSLKNLKGYGLLKQTTSLQIF